MNMVFRDLSVGEQFVFSYRRETPCEKVSEREYIVLETNTPGRVGVGDNPVERVRIGSGNTAAMEQADSTHRSEAQ